MSLKRIALPGHLQYPVHIVQAHFLAGQAVDERDILYTLSDAAGVRGIMRAPFSGIIREGPVEAGSTFSASVPVVGLEPGATDATASQGSKDESAERSEPEGPSTADQQGPAIKTEAIWLSSPADAAYPLVLMRREAVAKVGKFVKKDEPLYTFATDDVKLVKIYAPCDGEVLEIADDDSWDEEKPLIKILPADAAEERAADPPEPENEDIADQLQVNLDEDLEKVLAQVPGFAKGRTLGAVRASITRALEVRGHSSEDAKRAAGSEEVLRIWTLANQSEEEKPASEAGFASNKVQATPKSPVGKTRKSVPDNDTDTQTPSPEPVASPLPPQPGKKKGRRITFSNFFAGLIIAAFTWAIIYVKSDFLFINSDFVEFGVFLVAAMVVAYIWYGEESRKSPRYMLMSLVIVSLAVAFYPLDDSAFLSRLMSSGPEDQALLGAPRSALELQNLRRLSNGTTPTPTIDQQQSFERFMSQ